MKLKQDFFVGVQNVDQDKKLRNHALLEMMSDISMLHGAKAGQTLPEGRSPVSWIVLGWRVRVYQRPVMFSTVSAWTWAQKHGHIRANRDYLVCDEKGEKIAEATSEWTPIDTKTGKFLRITPEVIGPFDPEPEQVNFPGYKLPALRRFDMEPDITRQIELNSSMFDYNRHVHNSIYLVLAEQILPEEVVRGDIDEFEIVYKMEITRMQPVRLEYKGQGDTHTVAIRSADGDTLHAVVILKNRGGL